MALPPSWRLAIQIGELLAIVKAYFELFNHAKLQFDKQKIFGSKKRIKINLEDDYIEDFFNTAHFATPTSENTLPHHLSTILMMCPLEEFSLQRPSGPSKKKAKEKKSIDSNNVSLQEFRQIQVELKQFFQQKFQKKK